MTATNHVLTGSLIVVAVHQPAVALPLAFAAHFALDALPHFGNRHASYAANMHLVKRVLPFDAAVALVVLLLIAIIRPADWPLVMLGGVLCASPDLMWMPGFIRSLRGEKQRRQLHGLMKFHSFIQWGERPWGIWLEAVWFLAIGFVLAAKLWPIVY